MRKILFVNIGFGILGGLLLFLKLWRLLVGAGEASSLHEKLIGLAITIPCLLIVYCVNMKLLKRYNIRNEELKIRLIRNMILVIGISILAVYVMYLVYFGSLYLLQK